MRDDKVPDALLAALDVERADAVSLSALADWYEEHGDQKAVECLRWAVRNGRRPGHYERQSQYGKYFWERQEAQPILNDPGAQLPASLWDALKKNDEPHRVGSFKSYSGPRTAYIALVEAWRALGQPVADLA